MKRQSVTIRRPDGRVLLRHSRWCASFSSKLFGLMFRAPLAEHESLVLVEPRAGRMATAIHMFFVSFPIATVWLDDAGRVVDKVRAEPWRPYYAPRAPARYTLEAHANFLDRVAIGDLLVMEDDRG